MTDNKRLANFNYALGRSPGNLVNKSYCQKINTIGIIVHQLESYFTISALKAIRETIAGSGYELIVMHSQQSIEKEEANARLLFESGVAGLIVLLTAHTTRLDYFEVFAKPGIPIIFFDFSEANSYGDRIIADNWGCGYKATEHLIKQGCHRIAIVTCGQYKNVNLQRYKGYRAALEKYDISFGPELMMAGDQDKNAGIYAAGQIMQMNPRPDGLFFTDDLEATVCMHILREAGIRIPQDIAIVGFNNDPISRLIFPTLTTIDNPGCDVGKAAATRLLDHLTDRQPQAYSKTTVIPARLIVRNSSLKTPYAVA